MGSFVHLTHERSAQRPRGHLIVTVNLDTVVLDAVTSTSVLLTHTTVQRKHFAKTPQDRSFAAVGPDGWVMGIPAVM